MFNIYDLNQLIENQAIRYTTLQLVQREDINAIRFSTLNPQYLLISHDSKDHTLLDIPTLDSIVQHIYVYPISEACDIIDPNTSEDCFVAPTSVPEPQEGCPIIWQGEGNFYLTQCAEIYWQPEDSSPILARTISLQSNIIQLEQTEDDRLVIIGENRLTILDSQTMQGDIYTIGDLETEAQYLFIDATQEQFFIVHHPKRRNTSWITVGTLK